MLPTPSARRIARPTATRVAPQPGMRLEPAEPAGSRMHTRGRATLAALTALAVVTLFTACSIPRHTDASAAPPDPFNPAAAQLLDDTSWQLSAWTQADGTDRAVPGGVTASGVNKNDGTPITLVLSTSTGQRHASGFSGCNRYMGTYSLKDGKLSFGPLAGTRMACQTAGGEIEGAYLDGLAHIDRTGVQMRPPQELQLVLENGDKLVFTHQNSAHQDQK